MLALITSQATLHMASLASCIDDVVDRSAAKSNIIQKFFFLKILIYPFSQSMKPLLLDLHLNIYPLNLH